MSVFPPSSGPAINSPVKTFLLCFATLLAVSGVGMAQDQAVEAVDPAAFEQVVDKDATLTKLGEGLIAYGVRDGERSGVWLARPK